LLLIYLFSVLLRIKEEQIQRETMGDQEDGGKIVDVEAAHVLLRRLVESLQPSVGLLFEHVCRSPQDFGKRRI
jgi:hypothetical protein